MSQKKGTNNNSLPVGEISTIRQILVGDQMAEYEKRIAAMEEKIANLEQQLQAKVEEFNQRTNSQKEDILSNLSTLQSGVTERDKEQDQLIKEISSSQNKKITSIATMLRDMGEKLLNQ